jgi:hypothetical protein
MDRASVATRFLVVALTALSLPRPAVAEGLSSSDWRFTIEARAFGPLETVVRLEKGEATVRGSSRSGLGDLRTQLSAEGKAVFSDAGAPIAFQLTSSDGVTFAGELSAPNRAVPMTAALRAGKLTGTIAEGLLGGTFEAVPFEGSLPLRDYQALLSRLDETVRSRVFDPAQLDRDGWTAFRRLAGSIASRASDDADFLIGLRLAWRNDPFSHFQVKRSAVPFETMVSTLDSMRTGKESARLRFDGPVATLTVETMVGADTIEQIETAYRTIAERKPLALVIDLRDNGGGAFAVRPLVEHLIRAPFDAGWFVSNGWWRSHEGPPGAGDARAVAPWQGWSVAAFWRDVQSQGLIRIRFEPREPVFEGPVFVVTNRRSASATELAADALRASGRATIVGETTLGRMLSGSMFDLADGFVVVLPVADYTSATSGRIEGKGVAPDVVVPAGEALDRARTMAAEAAREATRPPPPRH